MKISLHPAVSCAKDGINVQDPKPHASIPKELDSESSFSYVNDALNKRVLSLSYPSTTPIACKLNIQISRASSLTPDDVFKVGQRATDNLGTNTIEPRRQVASAVAKFHTDLMRLKINLEELGKADEDGKHYNLSRSKAVALILIFFRKWDGKELIKLTSKDMAFQDWKELLVDVKKSAKDSSDTSSLMFDVAAVLGELVGKFVPDSMADKDGQKILAVLNTNSRSHAEKKLDTGSAEAELKWLTQIVSSKDKRVLDQAASVFGFGGGNDSGQEAKIAASQWTALVGRLDAEVSPWQNRLNATMQKAQHDMGTLNSFWAKINEIIRAMLTDLRGVLH